MMYVEKDLGKKRFLAYLTYWKQSKLNCYARLVSTDERSNVPYLLIVGYFFSPPLVLELPMSLFIPFYFFIRRSSALV